MSLNDREKQILDLLAATKFALDRIVDAFMAMDAGQDDELGISLDRIAPVREDARGSPLAPFWHTPSEQP